MVLLISGKPVGIRKRNDGDRNPARLKTILECPHLAEMGLAGQSGEVAEKDQQKIIVKAIGELNRIAVQIEQVQAIEGDLFH